MLKPIVVLVVLIGLVVPVLAQETETQEPQSVQTETQPEPSQELVELRIQNELLQRELDTVNRVGGWMVGLIGAVLGSTVALVLILSVYNWYSLKQRSQREEDFIVRETRQYVDRHVDDLTTKVEGAIEKVTKIREESIPAVQDSLRREISDSSKELMKAVHARMMPLADAQIVSLMDDWFRAVGDGNYDDALIPAERIVRIATSIGNPITVGWGVDWIQRALNKLSFLPKGIKARISQTIKEIPGGLLDSLEHKTRVDKILKRLDELPDKPPEPSPTSSD